MAKDPWMKNYPLGSLTSKSNHELAEPTVADKRKRKLLEDYKDGLINQRELALALRNISDEDSDFTFDDYNDPMTELI